MIKGATAVIVAGLTVAGCATGPTRFPVEATRYHYDPVLDRGTIAIGYAQPGEPSLQDQAFTAAVRAEMLRLGFAEPGPGVQSRFRVEVSVDRTSRPLPPRHSPISIGLGGGGFSGGGYRGGGGVGLGGGVSFPVGGGRAREGVFTTLGVRIRRGPDAICEGQARALADAGAPDATAQATAARLARVLFTGFPGESGRTIEVK